MRKICVIILLILCIGLSFNVVCFGQSAIPALKADASTPEQLMQMLAGTWLREDYITVLKKTKSPQRAVQGLDEVQADFRINEDQKYELSLIYHFHEGIAWEIEKLTPLTKNHFKLSFTTKYGPTQDEYRIALDNAVNPLRLTLQSPKGKFTFRKIAEKSTEDFVNKLVFEGQYRDGAGAVYLFKPNQIAVWPEKRFKYHLGLDYVFSKNNYLWLVDEHDNHLGVFYTYKWKKDRLLLYKASIPQGEAVVPEKAPCAILEKSGGK